MLDIDPDRVRTRESPGRLSLLRALERVLEPTGFPEGSSDILFRDAQFGRDALETAEDLLDIRPDIARAVIIRLAELQGTTYDSSTEEEPGRIHHEYRARILNGHPVHETSLEILDKLSRYWRFPRDSSEYITYSTVDATPLFVRLVSRYVHAYGASILSERYAPRRWSGGEQPQIIDSFKSAVDWIRRRLSSSSLGLLEFQHLDEHGSLIQAWKDGGISYLHPDGRYVNNNAPIASIEVQGLAYDALLAAIELPQTPTSYTFDLLDAAKRLQSTVLDRFWMPEARYFAMALDRDPFSLEPRQVKLITSNPAEMLDSRIFDNLDKNGRDAYLGAIAQRIYGDEFLTAAGIRCTSLVHRDLVNFSAYQSCWTVWHKASYDVAKGLRRQGFGRLAGDLETRIVNAVNLSGRAGEFLYVTPDDRIAYRVEREYHEGDERIVGTNVPERDQAWSIAAALAIKWRQGHGSADSPAAARSTAELEKRILASIQPAELITNLAQTDVADGRFWVDIKAAWQCEREFRELHTI